MSDPYRGQYDQQDRPARRGREDEGQYTTRHSRYPQPIREYDSPRSPIHSRDQGPMSPRRAKAFQDPTFSEDEENDTDDELAAQIAELMKMRKEKAKAKACQRSIDQQASQVNDMDRRSRNEGSHRGYEDSPMGRQAQGRRGDEFHMSPREEGSGDRHHHRDQDINVPPAARAPEFVRSERSNQAIGMGRPYGTANDNPLDPVNSQDFVPRGREAAAPVRDDSYKYYQGQRISSNVFSPGYGFRPSAPRNDTLPDPEELVGPYGAVHRIYPAPCPVAPPINANDGWADEMTAADTRSLPSVATASDHPAPSVSYRQQQDRPMSPPPSDHASVPAAQEEEEHQWEPKERDRPPHLSERERIELPRDAQAAAAPTKGSMVPWTDGGVQYSKEHFVETASEEPLPPPSQGSMVPFECGVVYKQENLNQEGASMTMDELLACFANHRRQPSYAPPKDAYGGGPRGGGGGFMPPRQPDSGWNRSAPGGERQGWGSRGDQGKDDGFGETQGEDEWGTSTAGKETNTGSWGGGGGDTGYGAYEESRGGYGGGGGGGRNCYNCGKDGHMSRECPGPRKAGGGGGGGNCFNCDKPGHLSRECPEPRIPVFRGTCRGCGKEGHRQSECPDGGYGGGYGDSYNPGGGAGWGDGSGFDYPPPARPAANIHPSRAALVNTSTHGNNNNATAQGRSADRAPRDGRARDNGYGGRDNRAATPAEASGDPTPNPSNDVDDDHGGW
ncbi:hypothetical protein I203_104823 [Kwoniella mangroviensis CBS 8507]|uniref:uncharacterized protein n=1 Tax=Kwoniella mangroviensis CBS 8507 TaxID=1296122 RepID=UPI00080CF9C2|nr:uncharacterized protein I203_00235 [Kwoniella mangroviensis CBS 8507]OCF70104.1 hypothetical protein I203_00235 [Kwoniella mangroviensis CBS 8507]